MRWAHDAKDIPIGDMCFYLYYGKIVDKNRLVQYWNNLFVHASDLPNGRGWSSLTWQILEGKEKIPVTIFEQENQLIVDQYTINSLYHFQVVN